jgi:hypothetical protein
MHARFCLIFAAAIFSRTVALAQQPIEFDALFPREKQRSMGLHKLTKKEKEALRAHVEAQLREAVTIGVNSGRKDAPSAPQKASGPSMDQVAGIKFTNEELAWVQQNPSISVAYIDGKRRMLAVCGVNWVLPLTPAERNWIWQNPTAGSEILRSKWDAEINRYRATHQLQP